MAVVLAAVADLIFMSKVRGAAPLAGVTVEAARRGVPLVDEVKRTGASLVVVDLAAQVHGGPEAVRALRASPEGGTIPVVGYCSHVLAEAMEQGRAAGCTRVVSQGEFSAKTVDLLKLAL